MKAYKRTENGVTSIVSKGEGLAEINHAMMEGKRQVEMMSSISRTDYAIEYKDGRSVRLLLVDAPAEEPAETDSEGRRIVAVKGKRYVVSAITPARPRTEGASSWVPEAYVTYWSGGPLGLPSGPTRFARGSAKPGTVARAIWDAVNA
ncbi:hypothetical protein [Streptomyces sp. bgisy032]|uniref:hypothetical protein n=1 Tax=Streptomyces sp. bgisy032 TaxID=3413773 RepID=UPI003D7647DF